MVTADIPAVPGLHLKSGGSISSQWSRARATGATAADAQPMTATAHPVRGRLRPWLRVALCPVTHSACPFWAPLSLGGAVRLLPLKHIDRCKCFSSRLPPSSTSNPRPIPERFLFLLIFGTPRGDPKPRKFASSLKHRGAVVGALRELMRCWEVRLGEMQCGEWGHGTAFSPSHLVHGSQETNNENPKQCFSS